MQENFDLDVPDSLLKLQLWFGEMISRPLNHDGKSHNTQKQKKIISAFINPGKVLSSTKRLEIYQQQYWYRFINTMQEVFPTLCHLFGYHCFNHLLAIPYLKEHRPNHWSLGQIGARFPRWIESTYRGKDKKIIQVAAQIDWTYWELFYTPIYPPLSFLEHEIPDMLNKKLSLQPHIRLFMLSFDLFSFRKKLLSKEVSYWIKRDFPRLKQSETSRYFLMFRNLEKNICFEEIQEGEWHFLKKINQHYSIEQACKEMEEKGGTALRQAEKQLPFWLQKWIRRNYLTQTQSCPPSIEGAFVFKNENKAAAPSNF